MARKKQKDIETTGDLRSVLLETIQGVRAGDIEPRQGATIAALSRSVLQSAKLDFEVQRFYKSLEAGESAEPLSIQLKS